MKIQVLLLGLAACGTSATTGTTMSGQNAFEVTSTAMVPRGFHCSANGGSTLTVIAADVDLQTMGCSSDPQQFELLSDVVEIGIATGGYLDNSAAPPIAAGMTFPILDEQVSDETLCGNIPTGTTGPIAIVMASHCPSSASCNKELYATSGSVVVSSVSSTTVEGTFDVTLVNNDRESQGTLTGSFVADVCP